MKIFSDYVKHYQSLSFPLTLTVEQAWLWVGLGLGTETSFLLLAVAVAHHFFFGNETQTESLGKKHANLSLMPHRSQRCHLGKNMITQTQTHDTGRIRHTPHSIRHICEYNMAHDATRIRHTVGCLSWVSPELYLTDYDYVSHNLVTGWLLPIVVGSLLVWFFALFGLGGPTTWLVLPQATKRWHTEKADPLHPQDKIRSPDENGLPNGPLATRHLTLQNRILERLELELEHWKVKRNTSGGRRLLLLLLLLLLLILVVAVAYSSLTIWAWKSMNPCHWIPECLDTL